MKIEFSAIVLVAVCGAAGATSRYLMGVWLKSWAPDSFPWATLSVNVIGCFLIGCLAGEFQSQRWLTPAVQQGLRAGFLGALTTFSAFGIESIQLWQFRGSGPALANVLANLVLGFLAAWVGVRVCHGSV